MCVCFSLDCFQLCYSCLLLTVYERIMLPPPTHTHAHTHTHTHTPLPQNDSTRCKDLTESFTDILTQVISRKLPQAFDYHGVPSPWIQIRLLRILAILGTDDLRTSEKIYHVVEDTLASAECTSNIGQGRGM